MARIKIEIPDNFIFSTELIAQIGDVNYGGHVGNDKFLLYAHETRVRFLREYQLSELNIGEQIGLIMTDSAIVYKSEVFAGDEILIELSVQDISKAGFDFIYLFKNKKTGKDIVYIKTGMLCLDYQLKKIKTIPTNFRLILTEK